MGGFIQIGQNARVLLGYKTPINGFYSFWVLYPELHYPALYGARGRILLGDRLFFYLSASTNQCQDRALSRDLGQCDDWTPGNADVGNNCSSKEFGGCNYDYKHRHPKYQSERGSAQHKRQC